MALESLKKTFWSTVSINAMPTIANCCLLTSCIIAIIRLPSRFAEPPFTHAFTTRLRTCLPTITPTLHSPYLPHLPSHLHLAFTSPPPWLIVCIAETCS
eukprot:c15762_g1_i1 orf=490-786(-)